MYSLYLSSRYANACCTILSCTVVSHLALTASPFPCGGRSVMYLNIFHISHNFWLLKASEASENFSSKLGLGKPCNVALL
uniref:Uncharacterized protein n=1 Tax=Panstrongylus lignarius TaxID=156445 RepID=A0A224XSV2_9HEMI